MLLININLKQTLNFIKIIAFKSKRTKYKCMKGIFSFVILLVR
jgi:hypothetical protein